MKSEEADSIWSMISAVWDLHPERSAEQAKVWIPALEGLDAERVMLLVGQWMKGNGPEKMPNPIAFVAEV